MKNKSWIIIGGGAAGLAAAVLLGRRGERVTLLEQNPKVGRKILVSGNGKCNITNRHIAPHRFYSHDQAFVASVLQGYDFGVIERFFASLGLPLVEGKEGQMFPMSLQASSVVTALTYEAEANGVTIVCDAKVQQIGREAEQFIVTSTQGEERATHLLLASGSPAAPHLGGSDSGYAFATRLGHTLLPRHPSLVQLLSEEPWVKGCAGVKTAGVAKLYANGEYVTEKKGDLLFTNYGISGLAILDLSREVSLRLAAFDYCELRLDLMPQLTKAQLTNLMLEYIRKESDKPIEVWLHGMVNKKLIPPLLQHAKCRAKQERQLNRKEINRLVHTIKNLPLSISDTRGFKGAEVATGGINTREIDPETMMSRIIPNLYFAGEILDVDGERGGFNFHWAWVTGMRVAGSL